MFLRKNLSVSLFFILALLCFAHSAAAFDWKGVLDSVENGVEDENGDPPRDATSSELDALDDLVAKGAAAGVVGPLGAGDLPNGSLHVKVFGEGTKYYGKVDGLMDTESKTLYISSAYFGAVLAEGKPIGDYTNHLDALETLQHEVMHISYEHVADQDEDPSDPDCPALECDPMGHCAHATIYGALAKMFCEAADKYEEPLTPEQEEELRALKEKAKNAASAARAFMSSDKCKCTEAEMTVDLTGGPPTTALVPKLPPGAEFATWNGCCPEEF